MSMDEVFSITTLRLKDDGPGFCFDARTVGLAGTIEVACTLILGNYGDINEAGYWPWAVVERQALDCIYPSLGDHDPVWFKWIGGEDGGYVPFDGKEVTEHPRLSGFAGKVANWSLIG